MANAELFEADTGASQGVVYLIDVSQPTLMAIAPTGDAVDPNTDFALTFDREVVAAEGSIIIKQADGTIIETIPVSSARVTINGNIISIDPVSLLNFSTSCVIDIESGAFEDSNGFSYGGLFN